MSIRYVEGVPYRRFCLRYTLRTGQRRRLVRWSPGFPWVVEEMMRELDARVDLDNVKEHSVTIVEVAS